MKGKNGVLTKRVAIVLLVGLNLLFLVALWVTSFSPSPAYGQTGGRAGEFLSVTAKAAGQTYDVLYILDVPGRKLYAFYPSGGRTEQLVAAQPRDLAQDFTGQ